MKKRSMVLLLALVMALGLCVTTAWAADGVSYFDPTVSGSDQNKSCETYTPVTGSTSTEPVTWEGGTSDAPKWYVVDNAVTISGKLNVTGHVNLILCDGKRLTAEKGIEVANNKSLTIYGQTSQSGKLVATGACVDGILDNSYGYGIFSGGTLTINGGEIEATGGTADSSIGIMASGTITINAGTVTATGGEANVESHGICAATDLIINGGTVNATGKKAVGDQYAISSGIFSYKNITINSGTVTAVGEKGEGASYGICALNFDLIVNGGTVIGKSTDDNGQAIVCGGAAYLPESYYYRTTADAAQYRTQNMYRPAALGGQCFELTTTALAPTSVEADAAIEPVKYMDHNGTGLVEGQCADYTTIVSRNGNVTLTGGTSEAPKWFVVKNDVTINGTLTFKDHARLILCDGAKLTVKGGSVDSVFCGILIRGTSDSETGGLTIYGQSGQTGELVAKGAAGDSNSESFGIYAYGALTVNGGVIEARGGADVGISYGIYSTHDMTINAGKVTAKGRTANGSYGIFAQENLIVNGGVIEATGDEASATGDEGGAISVGICVYNNDLIVNAGSVTARSGKATATGVEGTAESYGIYANDDLHIKNGTVIAETTADGDTTYKAAVYYGEAYSMPDAYGTAWWWRTAKDGTYQGHPAFRVTDFESNYFELITTDPYPHQHTRRQPGTTTTAPAGSDKGTEDKSGVVTSANTFDAGVAVYAGLGVLSLTGSAWVARKKW